MVDLRSDVDEGGLGKETKWKMGEERKNEGW